ncbi:MAG: TIR domain-containing protein [Xanthobacteraceae bacterium]
MIKNGIPPLAAGLGLAGAAGLLSLAVTGMLYSPTIVKRKAYFAFRFKDVMRVNNVRQSGKIGQDEEKNPRDFYDRSIWEQKSISDPESLKRLMREGVEHSSVVCVLVGTDTWQGRWVKYEIARAVLDKKGLLAVDINGLPHVQTRKSEPLGINPLAIMGVYAGSNGKVYLAENKWVPSVSNPAQYEWRWSRYDDFTDPVSCPQYLTLKSNSHVTALSEGTWRYDYLSENGMQKLGMWLDTAARQVSR